MRLVLLIFILTIYSCKQETPSKTVDNPPTTNVQTFESIVAGIPAMPKDEFKALFDNATYTDYIFHTLPFAISQDNKASVQANLGMIAQSPPDPISKDCKPLGRQFFHINGDIKYEADVYFTTDCIGYVFKDGNKTIYANGMTKEGRVFFANLLKQASNVQQNGQQ